jgi:DNA polymerase-1
MEPGLRIPPPVCMSARLSPDLIAAGAPLRGIGRGDAWLLLPDDACDLLEWLIDRGVLIIGLDVSFDLLVPCEYRPALLPKVIAHYNRDLVTDVPIRQKLIDIAEGTRKGKKYSLQALALRLLDRHIEKEDTWRLRYWGLVDTPLEQWPQDAIDYPLEDANVPWDLWHVQERDLAAINRLCVLSDQYRRARGSIVLRSTSAWGLRSDAEGCRILRESCEQGQDRLRPQLLDARLLEPKYKGRKPNKILTGYTVKRKAAKERLWEAAVANTPEGQDPWKVLKLSPKGIKIQREGGDWRKLELLSTDKEACADSDDLLMHDFSEYAQLGNLLTGFLKAVEQGIDKPIHTHYEILLETGRTSSSNPNVQNVRRAEGARECFIPRPGWCFIACDIDRAELHTLAQTCINLFGHSTLGETLNAGIDPHTRFGARLAGCSFEDLKARLKAKDPEAKEWRQRAKPANFGFPGGMGAAGMRRYAKTAYGVVLSRDEAIHLHESWKQEYPDIAGEYLRWIGDLCRGTGRTTIEHFDSGRWRGNIPFCVTANSFFQGMSADALIAMLWALWVKCVTPGTALYGCRLANEVHDEVLAEVPIDIAPYAALEMESTMIEAYNQYTRDVPVSASAVLMDRWSKNAERVVDANGMLQVWHYERQAA